MGKKYYIATRAAIGDSMLLVPLLRSIREAEPEAQIILSARPFVKEIFDNFDALTEFVPFTNWRSIFLLLRKIWRADAAIFPDWRGTESRLAWLAGIPIRVGPKYPNRSKGRMTHEVALSTDESGIHMTERNMELLRPLRSQPSVDTTLYMSPATPPEKAKVRQLLSAAGGQADGKKLILIAPYSSDWIKDWPEEKYQELIDRLAENYRVGLLGGKENREQAQKFRNCFSLVGETNIRETTYAIHMARLLICGCTSVLHFGSTTATPIIALYRPGKASIYAPRANCVVISSNIDCWPCKEKGCKDNLCMGRIEVDEVYQTAKKILNGACQNVTTPIPSGMTVKE